MAIGVTLRKAHPQGTGSAMKGDTFQTKARRVMLGNSPEFRRLRHAVEKAAGDQDRAIRNVCRLYGVNRLDALPGGIRASALALLNEPR
jgi:hypothetical protein